MLFVVRFDYITEYLDLHTVDFKQVIAEVFEFDIRSFDVCFGGDVLLNLDDLNPNDELEIVTNLEFINFDLEEGLFSEDVNQIQKSIRLGVDINSRNDNNDDALTNALKNRWLEAFQELLGHDITINIKDILHVIVRKKLVIYLKLYLELSNAELLRKRTMPLIHGDNNFFDRNGDTLMHIASKHGYNDIIEILYKFNEKLLHVSNSRGKLPIHVSKNTETWRLFKLLDTG